MRDRAPASKKRKKKKKKKVVIKSFGGGGFFFFFFEEEVGGRYGRGEHAPFCCHALTMLLRPAVCVGNHFLLTCINMRGRGGGSMNERARPFTMSACVAEKEEENIPLARGVGRVKQDEDECFFLSLSLSGVSSAVP